MRAFLVACLAILGLGAGGFFGLNVMQKSSGSAYTSHGARIDPQWAWRSVLRDGGATAPVAKTAKALAEASHGLTEECDVRTSWQWIFVDFGTPEGEPKTCTASQ
jgi:hypothetical protein